MSFQGHESKPSSKAIDKATTDCRTQSVVNVPHFPLD
jgi:hypothetical protein